MIDIKSQIIKPALDLEDIEVVASAEGWKLTDLRSLGFFLNRNFKYRRAIKITEQSGNNLSDYQVRIDLDATNFDFSHAQTNGDDIRFTDANGNLLSYWIEEWDAVNKTAKVWVKVPSIPANSTVKIYMYYGNPELSGKSNGYKTFVAFHDFETFLTAPWGGWNWCLDPRAVRFVGEHDRTYTGWNDPSTGDVVVAYLDASGESASKVIREALLKDDHIAPALLILPDGHILAFYTSHPGDYMWMRRSTNPEDITSWEAEQTIAYNPDHITYPNPVRLNNGRIYVFYRAGVSDNGDIHYVYSDDDGSTWSGDTALTEWGGANPYFKVAAVGNEIHIACSTSAPVGIKKNIYYFYSDDGGITWKKRDGTVISTPITPDNAELVYETPSGGATWIWDIALDSDRNPYIVFADDLESDNFKYRCARWTGSSWEITKITDANGAYICEIEPHYAAGVCLSHDDPTIAYCSVKVNNIWEIQKFKYSNGAWTKVKDITANSEKWNIRPVVPRNAADYAEVLWMYGDYIRADDFKTVIRPVIEYPEHIWEVGKDCADTAKKLPIRSSPGYKGIYALECGADERLLMLDLGADNTNLAVEVMFQDIVGTTQGQVLCLDNCESTAYYLMLGVKTDKSSDYYIYRVGGNWYVSTIPRSDGWHRFVIKMRPNGAILYIDGEKVAEVAEATAFDRILLGTYWTDSGTAKFDNLIVRKYTEPEPSVSLGEEETA